MLRALLDGRGFGPAVAAWRALDQPYELAEALYQHVRADLPADGAARLREAAGLAERLGAAPLAQRIARLAGATPARHGLTDRERDVLELLVVGHSNRQIAQRLHISPSTAGVHVSHILAKLGATSRTEAAAIALRESLVDPRA
jgi:DNA-binding NarL/FixJ family response regulator